MYTFRRRLQFVPVFVLALFLLVSCGKKEAAPPVTQGAVAQADQPQAANQTAPAPPSATAVVAEPENPPPPSSALSLPVGVNRRTDDLDVIVKKRNLRALVLLSPVGFFYDKGMPRGVNFEALEELQRFANKKLNLGKLDLKVSFLPTSPAQLEAELTEGLGDIIAYGVVITPDREKRVAFSNPIQTDVTQILVGGPRLGPVSSIQDLSGKQVYVNPLANNYALLQKLNDSLKQSGKSPINLKAADKNLTEDDIIQMVNAGLVESTVTSKQRADLWSKVLDHLTPHPEVVIASGGQVAWVMRKNNPQLKALVDEFVQGHAAGTSFGNTLLRRYLQNTKWIQNSTSKPEMEKYEAMAELFKKYSGEYNFDYLMLAAQGYQESLLDQSRRNPSGAVGIMQVIPKYAAASPINVPDVTTAEGNIHAGAKMLRNMTDTYFKDPKIDAVNRTLFAFASYNAGPNRIVRLQKEAKEMGLDPNVWFGNVELVAAKEIGQETVTYVGNIYKYYIAYKLTVEQNQAKVKARADAGKQ
jgi:membrane-bound lytic murein transglycosylase MltF